MGPVGIIGGSGLNKLPGIEKTEEKTVKTPFGEPSAPFQRGLLGEREIVFLARHGRGHRLLPSEVNYRANIWGFKELGVDHIISVSAVGSLKEEIRPLDIVLVDQFVDRTRSRWNSFFGEGLVAHVGFAQPTCASLRNILKEAAEKAGLSGRLHEKGTYLNMEGPAFSTRAESELYRSWGIDVIGMTTMTEARLAREAEICFATLALVTDYDCWREDDPGDTVSVEMIIRNLETNAANARRIIAEAVALLPAGQECECGHSLAGSIITEPAAVPESTRKKLDLIIGKYL